MTSKSDPEGGGKSVQPLKDLGPLEWSSLTLPKGFNDPDSVSRERPTFWSVGSNRWTKMIKENWFVPAGMFMTVAVFTHGMKHYYHQDSLKQNTMMRARVSFQFLTLVCLCGGVVVKGWWNSRKPTDIEDSSLFK